MTACHDCLSSNNHRRAFRAQPQLGHMLIPDDDKPTAASPKGALGKAAVPCPCPVDFCPCHRGHSSLPGGASSRSGLGPDACPCSCAWTDCDLPDRRPCLCGGSIIAACSSLPPWCGNHGSLQLARQAGLTKRSLALCGASVPKVVERRARFGKSCKNSFSSR